MSVKTRLVLPSTLALSLIGFAPTCGHAQTLGDFLRGLLTPNSGSAYQRPVVDPNSQNYIRLLAKDGPTVYIIYSGPETLRIGEDLQKNILAHPEFRGDRTSKIHLLDLHAAEEEAHSPTFDQQTRIFLLAGSELDTIPDWLQEKLPPTMKKLSFRAARAEGTQLVPKAGKLAHNIAIFSPSPTYLPHLYEEFKAVGVVNWQALKYQSVHPTRQILVFSDQQERKSLENWGLTRARNTWEASTWYPLSEYATLSPARMRGADIAMFIDRANKNGIVPDPAKQLIGGDNPPETISIVAKMPADEEKTISIIDTPTPELLRGKSILYSTPDSIPSVPRREEAKDCRKVYDTPLLVFSPLIY